jgi:pyruvate dehydrogenase E1 component alpha subunit
MGTAIHRHTANHENLISRGESYGIKSVAIDGFDVLDVYGEFKPLVDWCREAQKPAFVDLKTYRYQGHSMSDPQKYRSKDEVDQWKERDSIDALAHYLMSSKGDGGRACLTEDDWKGMQKEIREIVRDAITFAEESPVPDEAELYSDVFINPLPNSSPIGEYVRGAVNPLLEG